MRILLTSTSFHDTPGKHQAMLDSLGYTVETLRGPLKEKELLPIIADYDGIICGDDEITSEVIKKGKESKLKVVSKYGVGLDKIDLVAAEKYGIPVTNCPGVNHVTVAEHVIALLLTFYKNIHLENTFTKKGEWKRLIGHEVYGKKIGVVGFGKIGKEVAIRAKALGLEVGVFDIEPDFQFIEKLNVKCFNSVKELINFSEIISLNLPLNNNTKGLISMDLVKNEMNINTVLINTSRGALVDLNAVMYGLNENILSGYLTDVLEEEPMKKNHPLLRFENVIITPHIGSRTYQSVERQGLMAVNNLANNLPRV